MTIITILLLSLGVFAQDKAELEKYIQQIKEPTTCKPLRVPGKPYKTYQLNCCKPLTLKDGSYARIEDEGGDYKIGVYKSRVDAKPNSVSPTATRIVGLGSPNQQCLQMKYFSNFDIITVYQFKGQTAGYSEWAINVVKIEEGKPLKAREFPILNLDEGESSTILSPEIFVEGENLVLKLKNRLDDQPVERIEYLNKLNYKD